MKRIALISGILLLVFILVWGFGCAKPAPAPAPAPAPKAIKLKGISYKPPGSLVIDVYEDFLKRVTERSKGELVIEYGGGAEVVAEKDQPEAVRTGVIDVVIMPGSRFAGLVPEAYALPVTAISPMKEREVGFYAFMDGKFNTVNIKYIGRNNQNWFYWFTNKKVDKPQDLKGQKTRSTSTYNPFVKAIGAVPITMDRAEIYLALERGVIDGYITVIEEPVELRFNEVTKYIIDHYFYEGSNPAIVMNLAAWNKLPKHLQDLVMKTIIEYEKEIYPQSEKLAVAARKELIDKGVAPIKFSQEDGKWFRDLAFSAYFEDMKGKVSPESYAKITELLKK